MIKTDNLVIRFTTDGDGRVTASLANVERGMVGVERATNAGTARFNAMALAGKGLAVGALAAVAVGALRSAVEFEKLEARLVSYTGTQERATAVTDRMRQVAKATGGNLNELLNTFLRLESAGIKPTNERMVALSNIAAATGKSLAQVAEAASDATNGQAMALRQLGIAVRDEGERLKVTFRGITRDIANDGASIQKVLDDIGTNEFGGAAARQADTLSGAWDDLSGSAGRLAVAVGKTGLTQAMTDLLQVLAQAGEATSGYLEWLAGGSNKVEESNQQIEAALERRVELMRSLAALEGRRDGSTLGAGEGAFISRTIEQHRTELQQLEALLAKLYAEQDKLLGLTTQAAPAAAQQAASTQELSKETKELIAELSKLADTYGKSRSATLEYEKAQALSKAKTDEERQAIEAQYDALIAVVKATDAANTSERRATDGKRDAADAAEELDRKLRDQAEAELVGIRVRREALSIIDPYLAAMADLQEQTDLLVLAWQFGAITGAEFVKGLENIAKAAKGLEVEKLLGDADDVARVGQEHSSTYQESWEPALQDLSRMLTDALGAGMRGGLDDAGDALMRWIEGVALQQFEGMFKDIALTAQATMRGGYGLDYASFGSESSPGFVGPPSGAANSGAGAAGGGGGSGWTVGGTIAAGYGLYSTYQAAESGDIAGAALSGAATGAQIGTMIVPVIGTIVGAVIGLVVGALAGYLMQDAPPSISVIGENRIGQSPYRNLAPDAQFSTAFGDFAFGSIDTVDAEAREGFKKAITDFDAALAGLLSPTELASVRDRFADLDETFTEGAISAEEILGRRLGLVLKTVAPQWESFVMSFGSVEEQVKQFEALRGLEELATSIANAASQFGGDPIELLKQKFDALAESKDTALLALDAAIDSQDADAIKTAAEAAGRAVEAWAQQTIAAVRNLEAALDQLDAQSRAFVVSMQQRIASVSGGGLGAVISSLSTNRDMLRGRVASGGTPERSLAYLNEFIATVDAWLAQSTAEVNRILNERLSGLAEERAAIMAASEYRAQQAQNEQEARDRANEALREALQEQLQLAQQWQGILDATQRQLDEMRFGSANPLDAQSRFALLGAEADSLLELFRGQTGTDRTDTATRLLEILSQQQSLGQDLFQRPSPEALALYNEIVSRIGEVQAVAEPEAERARQLQEELNALAEATAAATGGTYGYLTGDEQARLAGIAEEERLAREEAQLALDELNELAKADYEWALSEGQRLQQEQRDLLQAQLDEITGGMDVQLFIAEVEAQARDALFDIRDSINLFLDAITTTGASLGQIGGAPGSGVGGGPGNGGGPIGAPGQPRSQASVNYSPVINVSGSNNPQATAAAVVEAINAKAPMVASIIKRHLQNA